jgi:murein L,D-transpeptidase YafK
MMLILGAAALLFARSSDTTALLSKIATPTVNHSPVVGVRSTVLADSVVVEKGKHTLTLFQAGLAVRTYQVALGKQPTGDKLKQGDNRTPEGTFFIDFKNPQSKYHKALHISYPDAAHAARSSALGYAPGGDIMIHGLPPAYASIGEQHRQWDWTEGCIAVTDREIEEIFAAIPTGAPIHIKP